MYGVAISSRSRDNRSWAGEEPETEEKPRCETRSPRVCSQPPRRGCFVSCSTSRSPRHARSAGRCRAKGSAEEWPSSLRVVSRFHFSPPPLLPFFISWLGLKYQRCPLRREQPSFSLVLQAAVPLRQSRQLRVWGLLRWKGLFLLSCLSLAPSALAASTRTSEEQKAPCIAASQRKDEAAGHSCASSGGEGCILSLGERGRGW